MIANEITESVFAMPEPDRLRALRPMGLTPPTAVPAAPPAELGVVGRGGPFCVNERPPIKFTQDAPANSDEDNPASRFMFAFACAAFLAFFEGIGDGWSGAICFALILASIAGCIAVCGKRALEWVLAFLFG